MPNQDFPSLNDMAPSWADVAVTISVHDGTVVETADIQGVKWSRKVEVGEVRGTSGGRLMKRTRGSASCEASATFYKEGYRKLIKALIAKAPSRGNQRPISTVGFDVTIQYTPIGEAEIYETRIKGCRLLGDSEDGKEGQDANMVEVTLNPIEIVEMIDGEEIVLL